MSSADSVDASTASDQNGSLVDKAVAEGGAYEVLRKRLGEQGSALANEINTINNARLEEFGKSDLSIATRTRIRTENNCIARDIVQVGPLLLFGYNVFIGLKKETQVEDVFSVFSLKGENGDYELAQVPNKNTFLNDATFQKDFSELYRYYKETRLLEITVKDSRLLMGFQISERQEDIRVFRWAISADASTLDYIDNRGERDIQLPPAYDFEWQQTTRNDTVNGRHPHVNILDTLFVETINGDLTIKVENNTEDGRGIYQEEVEDKTQSIDDAEYHYARIGELILLRILPYRESQWRCLIFNSLTQTVKRIDAISTSCVQLPEDHGIVFPGGYYLQSGEYKTFDDDYAQYRFKRAIKSPNGEDVLFIFYAAEEGTVALLSYNLIDKQLQNPLLSHGYALADDGKIVLFSAEEEATRIHPMQIWHTPFFSTEFASKQEVSQTFFGRIGNAELVRGVSDTLSICRLIDNQSVSVRLYEELSRAALKIFDDHYWLAENETQAIADKLKEIANTAELTIDEFEKVKSIRQQSDKALADAVDKQQSLIVDIRNGSWDNAEQYTDALDSLRKQRGHLATLKEYRYIDLPRIGQLDEELVDSQAKLSERTVNFLSNDDALKPYLARIDTIDTEVQAAATIAELSPLMETMEHIAAGLDLLSELMSTLKVDDATVRTRIIDAITQVYGRLNQSRAQAKHKQKDVGSEEATAQFSAQFKLFTQSITNALNLATTPDECDKQLSRLLVQLEELESQFSEFEQFLADIMSKREEIYESFESHKQQLLDAQQRKALSIADAANRVLDSIERRANKFKEADALNTYFASDSLVAKTREFIEQLHSLEASVNADDVASRFKSIKEQALRLLRDKSDIYEGDGNVIKLGPRHRFSVNTQNLDLTVIPRQGELYTHLTGTDFFEKIDNQELATLKDYWDVSIISESDALYRAEYLAGSILHAAEQGSDNLTHEYLHEQLLDSDKLNKLAQNFANPRYKEGYEKGIHDYDAARILEKIVPAIDAAGELKFDPLCRGLAQVFWANIERVSEQLHSQRLSYETWAERAQSAKQLETVFASNEASSLLANEIHRALVAFLELHPIDVPTLTIKRCAAYLVVELGREHIEFACSKYAKQLADELKRSMSDESWRRFQSALEQMLGWPAERWALSGAWLNALVVDKNLDSLRRYVPEAIALINADERIGRRFTEVDIEVSIDGLMGEHTRIQKRSLSLSIDDFLLRVAEHKNVFIPNYNRFIRTRQQFIDNERSAFRLEEFKPRPLSSFVRNRLINESYLPIIGDNLAKQMGTVGENKRTDLMGLLMMISPPGYGKTTLMEYVADRLGLIFMKINCPSLGHDVMSLDPEQAPNATARQELEKLNLALEMGNNVMLYLDDIQHTHPEFLQKFISLCDGTRRVEGIWKGNSKTYDMRGKKFCVVMAGNPYTESGEAFKIPDMLANRADIYNLGDILGGMDKQFELSYIENCLTSNAVLAPLATRDMSDSYKLFDLAEGKEIATTDLKHQYSAAEIKEITDVLQKLYVVRDVVLKINQQYIASAAQDDQYRTEPSFKLQGSYRNMNKMAEKISSVMNQGELIQLIDDHYLGESQLLTSGAEENLLKLAELRQTLTESKSARWNEIKANYVKSQAMGGKDSDTGTRVVSQLVDIASGMNTLNALASDNMQQVELYNKHQLSLAKKSFIAEKRRQKGEDDNKPASADTVILAAMDKIQATLAQTLSQTLTQTLDQSLGNIQVINQPVPGVDKVLRVLADTIENTIFPLVRSMDKKLEIDLRTHEKMNEVSTQLRTLESQLQAGQFNAPTKTSIKSKTTKPNT